MQSHRDQKRRRPIHPMPIYCICHMPTFGASILISHTRLLKINSSSKQTPSKGLYISLDRIFFSLDVPSNRPRSTAAATVKVPPTIAQRPARKPRKVLFFSSRLMTFMGEMSCDTVRWCAKYPPQCVFNLRMRKRHQEYRPWSAIAQHGPRRSRRLRQDFSCG